MKVASVGLGKEYNTKGSGIPVPGETKDTAQYPDKMQFYANYLDAHWDLVQDEVQDAGKANKRQKAWEQLINILSADENVRISGNDEEIPPFEAPPADGMEEKDWPVYKLMLLQAFSLDVLGVDEDEAEKQYGITFPNISSTQDLSIQNEPSPSAGPTVDSLKPFEKPSRTYPTIQQLEADHKKEIIKSLKESGSFDDDCLSDFQEKAYF